MLHLPTATPGGTARLRAGHSLLPEVKPRVPPLEYPQQLCPQWIFQSCQVKAVSPESIFEMYIQALRTAAALGLQRVLGSWLFSELSKMKCFVQKVGTRAQCKIPATAYDYFAQLNPSKKQPSTVIKRRLFCFLVVGDNCVNIVAIFKIKYILSRILFLH